MIIYDQCLFVFFFIVHFSSGDGGLRQWSGLFHSGDHNSSGGDFEAD